MPMPRLCGGSARDVAPSEQDARPRPALEARQQHQRRRLAASPTGRAASATPRARCRGRATSQRRGRASALGRGVALRDMLEAQQRHGHRDVAARPARARLSTARAQEPRRPPGVRCGTSQLGPMGTCRCRNPPTTCASCATRPWPPAAGSPRMPAPSWRRLRSQVERLMQDRVTPALGSAAETVEDYSRRARHTIEDSADAVASTVRSGRCSPSRPRRWRASWSAA